MNSVEKFLNEVNKELLKTAAESEKSLPKDPGAQTGTVSAESTQTGAAKEMTGTSFRDASRPQETAYDSGIDYSIEEERRRKAQQVGETSFADPEGAKVVNSVMKSAKLANEILAGIKKKASSAQASGTKVANGPWCDKPAPKTVVPLTDKEKQVLSQMPAEKQAAYIEERNRGSAAYLQDLQKQASAEYIKGGQMAEDMIKEAAADYQAGQKIAEMFKADPKTTIDELQKCASQGNQKAIAILTELEKQASVVHAIQTQPREVLEHLKKQASVGNQEAVAILTEMQKQASVIDAVKKNPEAVLNELQKQASVGNQHAIVVLNELQKSAQQEYAIGYNLADQYIQKMAADLVAIRPVLQDMMAKNILTQEEKDAVISYLSGAEMLTPEIVDEATRSLSNAQVVADAIMKAIDGPQGANVVPQPAQSVSVPTSSPEAASVEGEMPGAGMPKSTDMEDAIIIQAAQKIMAKNKKPAAPAPAKKPAAQFPSLFGGSY